MHGAHLGDPAHLREPRDEVAQVLFGREHPFRNEIAMSGHHTDPTYFIQCRHRLGHRLELGWLDAKLRQGVDRKADLCAIREDTDSDDTLANQSLNPARDGGTWHVKGESNFARRLATIVLQRGNNPQIELVEGEPITRRGATSCARCEKAQMVGTTALYRLMGESSIISAKSRLNAHIFSSSLHQNTEVDCIRSAKSLGARGDG